MNIDELTMGELRRVSSLVDRANRENIALALLTRYDEADTAERRAALNDILRPDVVESMSARWDTAEREVAEALREATMSPSRGVIPGAFPFDPRTPQGRSKIADYRSERRTERGGDLPAVDLDTHLALRDKVTALRNAVSFGTEASAKKVLADLITEPVNLHGAMEAAAAQEPPAAVPEYLSHSTDISPPAELPDRLGAAELELHDLPESDRYTVLTNAVALLEQASRECAVLALLRDDKVAPVGNALELLPSLGSSLRGPDERVTDELLIAISAVSAAAKGGTGVEDVQRDLNARLSGKIINVAEQLATLRTKRGGAEPEGEFLDWVKAHQQFRVAHDLFQKTYGVHADFRLDPRPFGVERDSVKSAVTTARKMLEVDAERKELDDSRDLARSARSDIPDVVVPIVGAVGVVGGIVGLATGAMPAEGAGPLIGLGVVTCLASLERAGRVTGLLRSSRGEVRTAKERVATSEERYRAAGRDFRGTLRLATPAAGRGRTVGGAS